jgi:hypothetical protein
MKNENRMMGREQEPDSADLEDFPSGNPCPGSGFAEAARFVGETLRAFGPPSFWPYAPFRAAAELMLNFYDPAYRGKDIRFGDGKPVLLVPGHLGGNATLTPLSLWLRAIGYRPVAPRVAINMDDRSLDEPIAVALRTASRRIGRKAVIVAFDSGARAALRVAAADHRHVSDLVALGLPDGHPPKPSGLRLHVIESARRMPNDHRHDVHIVEGSPALLQVNPNALRLLSQILREIPISLLDQA